MKFIRLYMILAVMLFAPMALAFAQDEGPLGYGDSIQGEITNRNFEIEYSFEGTVGEVVVIQMTPEDTRDGLTRPSVILLDTEFEVLSTVTGNRDAATLVYMLPADGEYFILATRHDGRAGDSVGAYTLVIDQVSELAAGETVEGSVTNTTTNLYAVKPSMAFELVYERLDGDFFPEISVQVIDPDTFGNTNLSPVMVAQGSQLARAALSITSADEEIYIVVVTRALFTFSSREISANYALMLNSAE